MSEKLFDNPVVDRQWPLSMTEEEMALVGFGYTGDQRVYRYPNGFGASLVQICILRTEPNKIVPYTGVHPVTDEPLWELGVVQFNSDDDLDFTLTFDTTVADDVLRFVTDSRAELILQEIKELVVGVPKQFLPELLSSGCRPVREAAEERLEKLDGLECGTA